MRGYSLCLDNTKTRRRVVPKYDNELRKLILERFHDQANHHGKTSLCLLVIISTFDKICKISSQSDVCSKRFKHPTFDLKYCKSLHINIHYDIM